MSKMYFPLFVALLFFSCKEAPSETAEGQEAGWNVVTSEWQKKNRINPKAGDILESWNEYNELDASFDKIYKSEFREDFVLAIEDLIEKQKVLEASTYPEEFDIPQIKGRQKIFKTYVLKTKGNLEYRQDLEPTIKEMITAYNNFREQFNVTVNSTLPEDLISNEKE